MCLMSSHSFQVQFSFVFYIIFSFIINFLAGKDKFYKSKFETCVYNLETHVYKLDLYVSNLETKNLYCSEEEFV